MGTIFEFGRVLSKRTAASGLHCNLLGRVHTVSVCHLKCLFPPLKCDNIMERIWSIMLSNAFQM